MKVKSLGAWLLSAVFVLNTFSNIALAETSKKSKTYTEDEFITSFSGKPKKVVMDQLGAPIKKEQSVKPTGANEMMAGKMVESNTPTNVEMWYYKGVVKYAPKKTYSSTELTFVNDRCTNIAFFNK